jgi:hypothetical protein
MHLCTLFNYVTFISGYVAFSGRIINELISKYMKGSGCCPIVILYWHSAGVTE